MNIIIDATLAEVMPGVPPGVRAATDTILRSVSILSGVSREEILHGGRQARVARARHIAMWLMRECTDLSFQEIGHLFGRDHSTVMCACKNVATWRQQDSRLAASLAAIGRQRDPAQPLFMPSRA